MIVWSSKQDLTIIIELQRVIERTFAPDTTESDGIAENDIVGVVVEGGSVGNPREAIADVVVLTDDGQQK